MNKKISIWVFLIICTVITLTYAQTDTKTRASVKFVIEGKTYVIEVGEIQTDKDGNNIVTIYSSSISAAISQNSISAMFPFIPCAVLENETILDPIMFIEAGIIKPDGSKGAGYKMENKSTVPKKEERLLLGYWPDATKGFLSFTFNTKSPIKDIIIGTYTDYAKSNYTAFLSSGVSTPKNK